MTQGIGRRTRQCRCSEGMTGHFWMTGARDRCGAGSLFPGILKKACSVVVAPGFLFLGMPVCCLMPHVGDNFFPDGCGLEAA